MRGQACSAGGPAWWRSLAWPGCQPNQGRPRLRPNLWKKTGKKRPASLSRPRWRGRRNNSTLSRRKIRVAITKKAHTGQIPAGQAAFGQRQASRTAGPGTARPDGHFQARPDLWKKPGKRPATHDTTCHLFGTGQPKPIPLAARTARTKKALAGQTPRVFFSLPIGVCQVSPAQPKWFVHALRHSQARRPIPARPRHSAVVHKKLKG